jgi:guanine deaminase
MKLDDMELGFMELGFMELGFMELGFMELGDMELGFMELGDMELGFMKMACDLASDSVQKGGGPFGAVIVSRDGNIIGNGHNMVSINNDPTAHAEVICIRNACQNIGGFNLEDCTIYTSCEPCPMCLGAIYWSRIKKIYYGNTMHDAKECGFDDSFIYNEFAVDVDKRAIPMIRIGENFAKESFAKWCTKDDKINY